MKTAVITGTSTGLGFEIAKKLLEENYNVIGISRNSNNTLKNYNNFTQFNCDISNLKDLTDTFDKIEKIDILINNAAVFKKKNFENHTFEDIQSIININVLGTIYTTKLALNKINENGKIIFINSVAGLNEFPQQSIYCASKHAIKAFSAILSKELKNKNIKTISIHPGGINTTLWNENNPYPKGDAEKALNSKHIANLIEYLLNSPNYIEFKTITMFPEIEDH